MTNVYQKKFDSSMVNPSILVESPYYIKHIAVYTPEEYLFDTENNSLKSGIVISAFDIDAQVANDILIGKTGIYEIGDVALRKVTFTIPKGEGQDAREIIVTYIVTK